MSAAQRELRRLERGARERIAGHLVNLGAEAERMAGSTARHHPWGHVAAGGLLGLLIGAGSGSRRDCAPRAGARRPRVPRRLVLAWLLRGLPPV